MMPLSPISNLDNDTLLAIFDTITQRMPDRSVLQEYRPLAILRAASQVCPRWRGLLLASPLIWGRVIDLDVDRHGLQIIEWMEEVVRRAGPAPLWISGDIIEPVESRLFDKKSYFIRLLEHWERIEQLSVVIYGREIPNIIQSRFLSPAPNLKLFDVDLPEFPGLLFKTLQPGSSQSLFADNAPSLLEIKTDRVAFKLDSPWLSNLREMKSIPRRLTEKEFIILLQHTPVIESLSLDITGNKGWGQAPSLFSKPDLPKLSSICMSTNLAFAARILDYITPGKLSTLRIRIFDRRSCLGDNSILSSFSKNLPFYISSCFTSDQLVASTAVLLSITSCTFRFYDTPTESTYEGQNFDMLTNTRFDNQLDRDDVIACLLDTFTLGCTLGGKLFKSITKIRLSLIDVEHSVFPKLYSMLAAFHHVQDIETNDSSTQILFAISSLDRTAKDTGGLDAVLFPKLHTLRLTSLYPDGDIVCADLPLFIIWRKDIGLPVAKLDLMNCMRSNYMRDLRVLEEVDGLEVVWKELGPESGEFDQICTYTCGTGEPERLIIDLRW